MRRRPQAAASMTHAAVALVYLAAARFGFLLASAPQRGPRIGPPPGTALVTLLPGGYGAGRGVLVGAFLATAFRNEPAVTAAGIAAGNTLEALLGVYLLRRFVGF